MNENNSEFILLGNRGSGKTMMIKQVLYEFGKKEKIKEIIKNNFDQKQKNLNNEELEQEYKIVIKHIKLKHSHHLYSLYSQEHIIEIKKLLNIQN